MRRYGTVNDRRKEFDNESIPATVRELTDAQALELQVIELSVVRKSFLCWQRLGTSFTCRRRPQILHCHQRKLISVLQTVIREH
jgi:hypothetical protein